jgi:hypothetical protein
MDSISTAFVALIERDVRAQTKDGHCCHLRRLGHAAGAGGIAGSGCGHETLLAREVSDALEAQRVDAKPMWVQIAEAEREVTTLDLLMASHA